MATKNRTAYNNAISRACYDRITLHVPAGRKEYLTKALEAVKEGPDQISLNAFFNEMLRQCCGMTPEEWKSKPPESGN